MPQDINKEDIDPNRKKLMKMLFVEYKKTAQRREVEQQKRLETLGKLAQAAQAKATAHNRSGQNNKSDEPSDALDSDEEQLFADYSYEYELTDMY